MTYFKVETVSGETYEFEGQCNELDYSDETYLVCKHYEKGVGYKCLALIPHVTVKCVIAWEV